MSDEENKPEEENIEALSKLELVEIIDSAVYVIQSLSELDGVVFIEDKEDILAIRKQSYKVIYAAQRKIIQQIKVS
jgi:hypothetical protein